MPIHHIEWKLIIEHTEQVEYIQNYSQQCQDFEIKTELIEMFRCEIV